MFLQRLFNTTTFQSLKQRFQRAGDDLNDRVTLYAPADRVYKREIHQLYEDMRAQGMRILEAIVEEFDNLYTACKIVTHAYFYSTPPVKLSHMLIFKANSPSHSKNVTHADF